jgi:beta-xylosidase
MCKTKLILFVTLLAILSVTAYKNPVQGDRDSPDPGVVFNGYNYYAATTEGWDGHYFPIWQSKDLFNFSQVGWIFPTKPSWAVQNFWAPEIHLIGSYYVAYYTARDTTGLLCIGVAYSQYPIGPYIDKGAPLLRNNS